MHNNTHGPSPAGPGSQMIGIIYDKHGHKENQSHTCVLGAWHHKEHLRCFTGHLAMNLFMRLHSDSQLNFYKANTPGEKQSWWKVPLIQEWKDQKAADKSYCSILKHCGVHWEKCTHLRKAGPEYASSRGELLPSEVATMSKH